MTNVQKSYLVAILLTVISVSMGYWKMKSNILADDSKSTRKSPNLTASEKNNQPRARQTNHQNSITKADGSIISIRSGSIKSIDDIKAAIQAAYLIDDNEKQCQALKEIAHLWTLKDPEGCLKWAISIANDKVGYEYVAAQIFLSLVGNNQSGKAIELLNEVPQGKLRDTAIGYGIWGMLDHEKIDLSEAQQMLSLIASKEQMDRSAGSLVTALITSNRLQDLKQMYDVFPFGMLKDSFGSSVLRNLVLKDPLSGLDWIRNNPEMNNTENYECLASGFAKLDPLRGIETANQISDTAIKKRYLSNLLNGWADKKPEEAGKWVIDEISKKDFDQMKDEFYSIAIKSLAHDQNLIFSQIQEINNPSERSAALLSASAALSKYNPERASELVVATSIGQLQNQSHAVAMTAKNWLARDPLKASKWIGDLEAGPMKDVAVSELVANILANDKDIAMANSWAAQIQNTKIREQIINKIGKSKP